jgi:hypothetical protein
MAQLVIGRYLVIPAWVVRLLHLKPYVTIDQAWDRAIRCKHTQYVVQFKQVIYTTALPNRKGLI